MIKTKYFSLLYLNKFDFGNRIIYQFVLFECKYLFSLIFFYFTKSEKKQDRYHTHAFNALSIKIFGDYNEYILLDEKDGTSECRLRKKIIKWFPRDCYHCIGESKKGCLTFLISGPWKKYWKEWINGRIIDYAWSRDKIFIRN